MGNNKKRPPRGSKSGLASVRQNAAAAEKQLRGEQEESMMQLAEALGEISEGEALAHLDSRLAFVERQVERLNARRDEADRGVQGEIAVMRARIEDALEAVGTTAEEQRAALIELEKRINAVVSEAERGSAEVSESLREEIVGKVHQTAHRLEKLEARIRGEMKAFEDGFDERARVLSQHATEGRDEIESRLEEAAVETESKIDSARSEILQLLAAERRELEAHLSEWGAEVRLGAQRLSESVEDRDKTTAGALETLKRELLNRIQASEEKTATSAVRLQSLLDQQKREIVSDEQEWSGIFGELGGDLSQLKVRVEELSGRVSAAEARRANEQGSVQAGVEGMAARLDALEQKVRDAVEQMIAKQGTRLELLQSQVASIAEAEVDSEEQIGAVDYLKRRVGEMAERVDEIVVKVNAIGKYVTKTGLPRAAPETREPDPAMTEIFERLGSLEKAISDLASSVAEEREREREQEREQWPQPFAPGSYVPADLSVRVDATTKPTASTIIPAKRRRW